MKRGNIIEFDWGQMNQDQREALFEAERVLARAGVYFDSGGG